MYVSGRVFFRFFLHIEKIFWQTVCEAVARDFFGGAKSFQGVQKISYKTPQIH